MAVTINDNINDNTKARQPALRYTVEIYRGEEDGGLKTVDFESRKLAREFAERWRARGCAVQIHDHRARKVIYDEM